MLARSACGTVTKLGLMKDEQRKEQVIEGKRSGPNTNLKVRNDVFPIEMPFRKSLFARQGERFQHFFQLWLILFYWKDCFQKKTVHLDWVLVVTESCSCSSVKVESAYCRDERKLKTFCVLFLRSCHRPHSCINPRKILTICAFDDWTAARQRNLCDVILWHHHLEANQNWWGVKKKKMWVSQNSNHTINDSRWRCTMHTMWACVGSVLVQKHWYSVTPRTERVRKMANGVQQPIKLGRWWCNSTYLKAKLFSLHKCTQWRTRKPPTQWFPNS